MLELVKAGRLDEARQLQRTIMPLARLVGGRHGVPALKAALDAIGYEGGPPRPPLRPVSGDVVAELKRELESVRRSESHAGRS
jgi:4-hydroxy-2-oxoglutarate aldolase